MTSSQEPTGVLRRVLRRLHQSEAGQGLVEYALIIVVVSLGSLVALNFLSDEVSNLFNKTGSSIREGAGASAGGGNPGGGSNPSPPPAGNPAGTLPGSTPGLGGGTGTGNEGYFVPGSAVTNSGGGTSNVGFSGLPGVYTDNPPNNTETGDACSIAVPGGTFTGVWIEHDAIPGNDSDWVVATTPPHTVDWACIAPNNAGVSVAISGGPAAGDTFTATTSGVGAAVSRSYYWRRTDNGVTTCQPPFDNSEGSNTNTTNATDSEDTDNGGLGYCLRVVVVTSGGAIVSATTVATGTPLPPSGGSVTISNLGGGDAAGYDDGDTLRATTSGWATNGSPITTYTYRWQRSDNWENGGTCSNNSLGTVQGPTVSASTTNDYATPPQPSGTQGDSIWVTVTATNGNGTSTSTSDCVVVYN